MLANKSTSLTLSKINSFNAENAFEEGFFIRISGAKMLHF